MALITFKKGLLANLPATYSEGTFYITTDERAMYLDVDSSTRVRIGDFQEFATLAALQANTNPSTTALYYVTDLNVLAKWNGTQYVQINLDTGATSAETTGTGNALDGVSYDPATRKLTFTKTTTFATPDDVDSKITVKVGALGQDADGTDYTVKAYVDAQIIASAYDDTALKARVSANETAIGVLNGDKTQAGSVAKQVADAVAAIVADAPEAYDTLKEISDWISSHASDASAMNSQILANKNDIAALETLVGALPDTAEATTIVAYIDEVIADLSIGDYAKAADLTAAVARIATLEDASHTHANKDLLDTYTQTEADLADAVAKRHSHANAAVLDGITAAKVTAWDAAEQNAKDYTDTQLQDSLTWGAF